MADVKILMMGGRRCGKSSVLASMVKQLFENSEITKFVRINQQRNNNATGVSLTKKQNDLESFLNMPKYNYYLVDFNADDNFSSYPFKVKIPDGRGDFCWGNIDIEFVDCPGESYHEQSRQDLYDRIRKEMPQTDIFIITVETPYLMDNDSDGGKFKKVNEVIDITQLFDEFITFKSDDDYKKIIFVPVKCEAWRDRLDVVAEKLQQENYYGPLFERIKHEPRWSCCIIPALTAGGIEFMEFGEPFLLNGTECSPLGTMKVRMKDGNEYTLKPEDRPVKNEEHELFFPFYSWYENNGEYKPENCDQVALHVMRFITFKTIVERSHSIIPNWLANFPSNSNMITMIRNLESNNLLKDGNPNSSGVDKGIVHIRKIEKV